MEKAFTKTEANSYHVIHFVYDDGKQEIETLTQAQILRLRKTKRWKQCIAVTKLQELHIQVRMKIYPAGYHIKPTNHDF
jgi:hypothetical protein